MRVFGNLMNRIAETVKPLVPEVGMGATILMYSDRHAATVIEILDVRMISKQPTKIIVQQDRAIRTDSNGQSEAQEYRFEPDANGRKYTFTLRKNGTYVEAGASMRNGTIVRLGERDSYHDYSF